MILKVISNECLKMCPLKCEPVLSMSLLYIDCEVSMLSHCCYRVFHTLVKASGEYFNSKRTENIEKGYIAKVSPYITTCL